MVIAAVASTELPGNQFKTMEKIKGSRILLSYSSIRRPLSHFPTAGFRTNGLSLELSLSIHFQVLGCVESALGNSKGEKVSLPPEDAF